MREVAAALTGAYSLVEDHLKSILNEVVPES